MLIASHKDMRPSKTILHGATILIDASRDKIWDFTATEENFTVGQSNLINFEPDSDAPLELGRTARCTTRVAGRNIDYTMTATSWEPGVGNTWTSEDSPIPFVYTSSMVDEDGQTRVTHRLDSEGFGGFFGKLSDPVVTGCMPTTWPAISPSSRT